MSENTFKEEYGIVIILDVLGIKGIWRDHNPKRILDEWERFSKEMQEGIAYYEKEHGTETSFNVFSDTIIITVTGDIEKNFNDISHYLQAILEVGVIGGFPMRGAISIGPFYKSKKMIIGPAIDECSQYYETIDCIGILASPSFYGFLERISKKKKLSEHVNFHFLKSNIPAKDGKTLKNYFVMTVNWRNKLAKSIKKEFPQFETYNEVVHFKLEHLDTVEASNKLKNTIELMTEHKSKFEKKYKK